jgi:hypothetical protein
MMLHQKSWRADRFNPTMTRPRAPEFHFQKGVVAPFLSPDRKEMTLAIKTSEEHSTTARARAEASFKKEERAKDGALAMTEYLAQGRIARERMEQLRALRLAKEAAEKKAAEKKATEKETAAAAEQPARAKRARKV